MPVELVVCAYYPDRADQLFARARSFSETVRVAWPLTCFRGLPPADMIEGRTYVTDISVFGLFRVPGYRIQIETLDPDQRIMQSREGNDKIRSWDHFLCVDTQAYGSRWVDRVTIDAADATPWVAQFARLIYLWRHRCRRAMRVRTQIRTV